jgi:hypothetical protein
MGDLAHQAYLVIRESLAPENIIEHVAWLDRKDQVHHGNGTQNGGAINGSGSVNGSTTSPVGEWAATPRYGEYSINLKTDM